LIDPGRGEVALQRIKNGLNSYLGRTFENIAKEFLWDFNLKEDIPFSFLKLGSWWYKEREIDIVALDDESNIFFCEVKWKDMSEAETLSLIKQLKEKSKHVHWHNEDRNEYYGIIARTIKGKEKLTDAGYFIFDLNDFDKWVVE